MKATISADGVLSIAPENSIEQYALSQWWRHYENGDFKSVLAIELDGTTTPNES
jgi:transposase-like protein